MEERQEQDVRSMQVYGYEKLRRGVSIVNNSLLQQPRLAR